MYVAYDMGLIERGVRCRINSRVLRLVLIAMTSWKITDTSSGREDSRGSYNGEARKIYCSDNKENGDIDTRATQEESKTKALGERRSKLCRRRVDKIRWTWTRDKDHMHHLPYRCWGEVQDVDDHHWVGDMHTSQYGLPHCSKLMILLANF